MAGQCRAKVPRLRRECNRFRGALASGASHAYNDALKDCA